MLRRSTFRWAPVSSLLPVHRDTNKTPQIVAEKGTWHYNADSMREFQAWCKSHQCRAYGNIKITSTIHFARCLRVAKPIYPGQAIITCPTSACFNYLTVAKEMYDCACTAFPLQINWMNYNDRLPFLKSGCMFEFAQSGWMCRVVSLEESPFAPYIKFLLEDTRGKDGIYSGVSKEKEETSGMMDHYLSEMATDACEDPEVFLENFFRSLAALHLRSQPIETEAIQYFIPGTNFFKAKANEMYTPTLMPLIDCVPQVEDGTHNTVVEFFPYRGVEELKAQCRALQLPFFEHGSAPIVSGVRHTSAGVEQTINVEHELMDPRLLEGGGFFALRAMQALEEGDVLYLRRYSREGGDSETSQMSAQMMNAGRMLSMD